MSKIRISKRLQPDIVEFDGFREDDPRRNIKWLTESIDRILSRDRMEQARKLQRKLFTSGAIDADSAPGQAVQGKEEVKERAKDNEKGKVRIKAKEKVKERTRENNLSLTIIMKKETTVVEVSATRLRVTANATMKVVLMFISPRTKSTVPLVAAAISGVRLANVLALVSRVVK